MLALGDVVRYARWRDGDRAARCAPRCRDAASSDGVAPAWLAQHASGDGRSRPTTSGPHSCSPARPPGAAVDPRARRRRGRGRRRTDRLAGRAQDDRARAGPPGATSEASAWTSRTRPSCGRTPRRCSRASPQLAAADADEPLEVQAMAPHGSACVVRSVEDPLFGPIVSFGLAGDASTCSATSRTACPADRRGRLRAGPRRPGGPAAVRLPRAAGARRRRAGGHHRARLGAGGRPAGAALAGAEPRGRLRARRGRPGCTGPVSRADRADATRRLPRV